MSRKVSGVKKYLVVVESPTKMRTISNFLSKEYEVKSTMGHIVDLPEERVGVYISKGFQPLFKVLPKKKHILEELKKASIGKEKIFIATDPDREGEAIGYHIKNKIKGRKKQDDRFLRVEFHEITEKAVRNAFSSPRNINMNLVNAQIARRVLDRIVGYFLSPLLWKKVKGGLSAGRVQSVALKFIVDREKQIEEFKPRKYWTIEVILKKENFEIKANLVREKDKQIMQIDTYQQAQKILEKIKDQEFKVVNVEEKIRKRLPPSPFNTSSLQQEAFNKLGFSTKKTMMIAQQLYEGVKLPQGQVGLITYMRTDSLKISDIALREILSFIEKRFGKEYLFSGKRSYKKGKFAQEAHEAIRPTDIHKLPEQIKEYLTEDQFKLYELIWKRTVASQMSPAQIKTQRIEIKTEQFYFVSNNQQIIFEGFLKIWPLSIQSQTLPVINKEDILKLCNLQSQEHTTQPPPRYTEATLVKLLEGKGIGRPSTYAVIISTLLQREYVYKKNNSLIPSELGILVASLLNKHFPDLINEEFTAQMEEKLDEIEEGKVVWNSILEEFYNKFKPQLDLAYKNIKKEVITTSRKCPLCGKQLIVKWGRFGKFLSCSGFPECRYSEQFSYGKCPQCGSKIVYRRSKKGRGFYACSNYPECKFTTSTLKNIIKEDE